MYRHTQVAYGMLFGMLITALVMGTLAVREGGAALWVGPAIVLTVAVLFTTLTIEIRDGELRSHFGPGVWRKRWRLDEIAHAELFPSRWWEGWGVRVTARGMLYNVQGTGAVEIRLRSGARFRLGSDEPHTLLEAIRSACGLDGQDERDVGAKG